MASDRDVPPAATGAPFDFRSILAAMEVAQRSWGAMPIASAMMPAIDPDELDRRIADLKTVEQWLVLNLGLLRTSVQALELQRAALSSMQGFAAGAQAMAEAAAQAQPQSSAGPIDPGAWWQTLQAQFQQIAEAAIAGSSAPGAVPNGSTGSGSTPGGASANVRSGRRGGRTGPDPAHAKPRTARKRG